MTALRDNERDDEPAKGAVAFTVTTPVDPAVLDADLTKRMKWRKPGGIVTDGDPSAASEDEPVTVWVLRDDVEAATFRAAVNAHQVPEEPEGDPLEALREKARDGDNLTGPEIQEALRLLLLR